MDDAVTVTRLENGNYKLGVHIADVSHYVTEGSPIDKEAADRATSIYLVDRVIPMIPHRLSNGICSLNPRVDRLTLSCEMEIDSEGTVVSHEIFQSVIKTTERMTYSDVNEILVDKNEELVQKYEPLVPMFEEMEQLAAILREKRMKRGAIDFDFKEAKILVGENGEPTDVVIRTRSVAEKLIEEFMLAANETVAEHFHWMDVPFIYRIHEEPNEAKLQKFFEFIVNFGYIVRGTANSVHPRALQEIIEAVEGKPEEMVVSTVMLRSMQKAKYSPENVGHFGLASECYCHFTSPIRRYPDLCIHRIIKEIINGGYAQTIDAYGEFVARAAEQSSARERRATDAERDVDDLYMTMYMSDHIGEEYDAVISGVTSFGLFAELPNTIEGFVPLESLYGEYVFDPDRFTLTGHYGCYTIGEEIRVKVIDVDFYRRRTEFRVLKKKNPTTMYATNENSEE